MKKPGALFLALLMLSSQVSLSLNVHLCLGTAVKHSLSLGHDHLHCGMDAPSEKCPEMASQPSPPEQLQKLSCCQNQNFSLTLDTYTPAGSQLLLSFPALAPGTPIYGFAFRQIEQKPPFYPNPPPPLLSSQRLTLLQCFII